MNVVCDHPKTSGIDAKMKPSAALRIALPRKERAITWSAFADSDPQRKPMIAFFLAAHVDDLREGGPSVWLRLPPKS